MTALVLIAAILVLGGVIATVGDRLGMQVGKARLSLFKMRPRQTATFITILTGTIISASTFALLFAVDEQLRRGVFDYQEIQADKRNAEIERDAAVREREEAQVERDTALNEQIAAERRLREINQSLQRAIAQRNRTETELNSTQSQLSQVAANYRRAQSLLQTVSQQATSLRADIQQLEADRRQQVAQRDAEIAARNRAIAERETQLRTLEEQRTLLAEEVQLLEQELQDLRRLRSGNVALLRNQPLASGIVRIVNPSAAPRAVDQILREANRIALQRIRPGTENFDEQVIRITNEQVEQLTNQIESGQDYVVRVLSAGNYVVGEPCVLAGEPCIQVYVTAARNEIIFEAGELVAATAIEPGAMDNERLIDRINLLLAAAQFRARQAGILSDGIQIADGRSETVSTFFERLRQYNQAVDIQAVTAEATYTAGPIRLELVAVQNGQVLFSTRTP
ncbi:DUF3084 domain-containing protein [Oscillatoria sp. FACHB-1407]|uniref:DUF3084 domain-containing protein n=1 Tax=Oscillatoria sp. FACHB-1407 TaxID=2692847 RepID=UPI00168694C4|nr:DUF3084 domain-containing protein [Oscillatoria sp. FACHB-1407]MBD2462646.1 DUF3084 domain-containing protein [Oscillatoria sp. FACHB-1407]